MGKQWKQWQTLFFRAPKSLQMVSAAMKLKDTCSLEKRYDKIGQHIKKQRYYFANKGLYSQSYDFSSSHVYMWELVHKEGGIDAFELWCWRRLLRVPWTARRSNQSILKEINPEYSIEGLMLKFQNFGHLMWRADSLEKTLMLGKIEGQRRRGRQRMRWLDGIIYSMDISLSKFLDMVKDKGSLVCCSPWGHKELDMTERLNNNSNQNYWAHAPQLESVHCNIMSCMMQGLSCMQQLCPMHPNKINEN